MPVKETILSTLERAADQPLGGLRFIDREENARFLSWTQIRDRARLIAGRLTRLGVHPSDRVAMIFPTSPEFFDAFFGVLLAGAVPVPLYPPVRLGRLEEYHAQTAAMIRACGATAVLVDGRVKRLLGETAAAARPRFGCFSLSDLPAGDFQFVSAAPDDLALVQFSSGTTVDPKPVALTHRALLAQATILNSFWPDREREPKVSGASWLPLYHDMGLIGCVLPALERPAVLTLVRPEDFVARPAIWLRTISRFGARVSPAPNFAYGLCVAKIRDEELVGVDLSCWRVAFAGAEFVAPAVLRAFGERFKPYGFDPSALTPCYGLSEASLAVTVAPLDRPFTSKHFDRGSLSMENRAVEAQEGQEITSVGKPLPGFGVRIVAPDGSDLPERRTGRIWVSGPSLMEGYLGRSEETARTLRSGWLDTGDLGFLFDGELFLTGRAKDVLIVRGRNHSPDEVERAVAGLPGFRAGCAVAVSFIADAAVAERLGLFVEVSRTAAREDHDRLPERARGAVLAATGLALDDVIVLSPGTLPRTSSGKLRRGETLRRYLVGALSPPAPVTRLRLAGAVARSTLAYVRFGLARGGKA